MTRNEWIVALVYIVSFAVMFVSVIWAHRGWNRANRGWEKANAALNRANDGWRRANEVNKALVIHMHELQAENTHLRQYRDRYR